MTTEAEQKAEEEKATARAELHERLVKWFQDAVDSTYDARLDSELSRDYYDLKMWTSEEITQIKARGQAPIVVPLIKTNVDYMLGAERMRRTKPRAFPRNQADEHAADAATEALRFVLDNNEFDPTRSEVFENLIIEGAGFGEVRAVPKGEQIEVVVSFIPWDRGFFDPFSRRRDFEDTRYRGQAIWMDYAEALRNWPDQEDAIEEAFQASNGDDTYDDKPDVWISSMRRRLRIIEMWYREGSNVFRCLFTKGGILEGPTPSPYRNEDGLPEDPYVFSSAYIARTGERYGFVKQLRDGNSEVNKRRSKFLHLLSTRQVRADKGAVEDVAAARRELARPDGWVETVPNFNFEVLPTGDMAQGQFALLQEAKSEIDAVGVNPALLGKGLNDASGRAIQTRQQAGQFEIGPLFDALRGWQRRVYRKSWNRIRQFWTEPRWVRVTDNPESPRWIGLNRPVTIADELRKQGREIPPAMEQDPRLAQVVRVENQLAELDVDIIVGEAPDYVTLRQEQFAVMADLAKAGVPIPPEALVKLSGVPNSDEVLTMLRGTPEEQARRQKEQEEAKRLEIEDAISKIVERRIRGQKTVADAEKARSGAEKLEAETAQILAEIAGFSPPAAGG